MLDVRNVDLTVYRREPRGAIDADLDIDGTDGAGDRHAPRACCPANAARRCGGCSTSSGETRGDVGDPDAATSTNGSRSAGRCAGCTRASAARRLCASFPAAFPVFALDRIWVHPRAALAERDAPRQPDRAHRRRITCRWWRTWDRREEAGHRDGKLARYRAGVAACSRSCHRRPSRGHRRLAMRGSPVTRRCTSARARRSRWWATRGRLSRRTDRPTRRAAAVTVGPRRRASAKRCGTVGPGDASWRDLTWDVDRDGHRRACRHAVDCDWLDARYQGDADNICPTRQSVAASPMIVRG